MGISTLLCTGDALLHISLLLAYSALASEPSLPITPQPRKTRCRPPGAPHLPRLPNSATTASCRLALRACTSRPSVLGR